MNCFSCVVIFFIFKN